jgi:hypothetical protein
MKVIFVILLIMFLAITIIFSIGSIGEPDKEFRKHYIMSSCIFGTITFSIFMIGTKLWN